MEQQMTQRMLTHLPPLILDRRAAPHSPKCPAQAPSHEAWQDTSIGWPPPSLPKDSIWRLHRVSWHLGVSPVSSMATALRPEGMGAPRNHPMQAVWSSPEALRWLKMRPLHPLQGLGEGREGRNAPGWLDHSGLPLQREGGERGEMDERREWGEVGERRQREENGETGNTRKALEKGAKREMGDRRETGGRRKDPVGEFAIVTPTWLYCAPPHRAVTLGWVAMPTCSLLHLVELRSQFVSFRSLDTIKRNRPYVMAAYGAWPIDEPSKDPPLSFPLPSLAHRPPSTHGFARRERAKRVRVEAGEPPEPSLSSLHSIRLPPLTVDVTSHHTGIGSLLNLLQLLHLASGVSGRAPVVPSTPCSSGWLVKDPLGIAGVRDDYVMPLPESWGGEEGWEERGWGERWGAGEGWKSRKDRRGEGGEGRQLVSGERKSEGGEVGGGFWRRSERRAPLLSQGLGGGGEGVSEGSIDPHDFRCHLSIGGADCAWPHVVPAWHQAVTHLFNGSTELAPAPTLPIRLTVLRTVPPPSPSLIGGDRGAGGGKEAGREHCNQSSLGLTLVWDVDALREAAAVVASEVRVVNILWRVVLLLGLVLDGAWG